MEKFILDNKENDSKSARRKRNMILATKDLKRSRHIPAKTTIGTMFSLYVSQH